MTERIFALSSVFLWQIHRRLNCTYDEGAFAADVVRRDFPVRTIFVLSNVSQVPSFTVSPSLLLEVTVRPRCASTRANPFHSLRMCARMAGSLTQIARLRGRFSFQSSSWLCLRRVLEHMKSHTFLASLFPIVILFVCSTYPNSTSVFTFLLMCTEDTVSNALRTIYVLGLGVGFCSGMCAAGVLRRRLGGGEQSTSDFSSACSSI